MKNAFALKTGWCVFFLFLSGILFGQKRYSLNLKTSIGINGFEGDEKRKSRFRDFHGSTSSGLDVTIGIDNHYFFNKKRTLGLSVGGYFNHSTFSRIVKDYIDHSSYLIHIDDKYKMEAKSFLIPIKFNVQHRKYTFFFGWIFNLHHQLEVDQNRIYRFVNDQEDVYQEWEGRIFPTLMYTDNLGNSIRVRPNKKRSASYIFGVGYQLNRWFSIDLEFRSFIIPNQIIKLVPNNNPRTSFDSIPQKITTNTLSLGLNWRIF